MLTIAKTHILSISIGFIVTCELSKNIKLNQNEYFHFPQQFVSVIHIFRHKFLFSTNHSNPRFRLENHSSSRGCPLPLSSIVTMWLHLLTCSTSAILNEMIAWRFLSVCFGLLDSDSASPAGTVKSRILPIRQFCRGRDSNIRIFYSGKKSFICAQCHFTERIERFFCDIFC